MMGVSKHRKKIKMDRGPKSKDELTDGQRRTPREDVEWHGLVV